MDGTIAPGKEVLDCAVGQGCAEALSVTSCSLAIAGFAVFRLAYAREKSVPGVDDGLERVPGHYPKRRDVFGFDRQKVWQGMEKPVIRCPGLFLLLHASWFYPATGMQLNWQEVPVDGWQAALAG